MTGGPREMQQEMEYVYQVYQERNVTRAAEKLFITQPALSMAIQRTEERLGAPLFDRSARPLELTEAGRLYISYIEHSLEQETELLQQIQDIRELNTGKIRIGGSHYVNAFILPRILKQFVSQYPKISVELEEASSAQLADMLTNKEIDITFHCSPELIREFRHHPAFTDHILLALPKDMAAGNTVLSAAAMTVTEVMRGQYAKAEQPCVPLREFNDFPFILLRRGNNLYERSLEMFEEAGITPIVRMELSQLATAFTMANAGLGATFISDRLVQANFDELLYFKIDSGLCTRNFCSLLPKRSYVSSAVQRFLEVLSQNEPTAGD